MWMGNIFLTLWQLCHVIRDTGCQEQKEGLAKCLEPGTKKQQHVIKVIKTRTHSSRMRTGRSLTVCWRSLLPGGCLLPGCLLRGVSAPRGVSALVGGYIPACTEADTPLLTESQIPVKTLPWPNFIAAGNNAF